jgi:hypothetical protein
MDIPSASDVRPADHGRQCRPALCNIGERPLFREPLRIQSYSCTSLAFRNLPGSKKSLNGSVVIFVIQLAEDFFEDVFHSDRRKHPQWHAICQRVHHRGAAMRWRRAPEGLRYPCLRGRAGEAVKTFVTVPSKG